MDQKQFSKLYDIDNFEKYSNFYTLYSKEENVYKRFDDQNSIPIERYSAYEKLVIYKDITYADNPTWVLIGSHNKIVPIYGHFTGDYNHFVYCNLNYNSFKPKVKYEKYVIRHDQLIKPKNSTYYMFTDIVDLKLYYGEIRHIIIEEEKEKYDKMSLDEIYNDILGITSYIESKEDLRIILFGKEI